MVIKKESRMYKGKKYSPDRKYYLKGSPQYLYSSGNDFSKRKITEIAGSGTPMSMYSSALSEIPMFWQDNNNYLFCTFYNGNQFFTLNDSIYANGEIYNVDISNEITTLIAKIDTVYYSAGNAFFKKYPDESIIFFYRRKDEKSLCVIDFENKELKKIIHIPCGNNFNLEYNLNKAYGRIIKFKNKEIGKIWTNSAIKKTSNGIIAVEYAKIGSNVRFPDGIIIWDNITNKWQQIIIDNRFVVIGWVDDFK